MNNSLRKRWRAPNVRVRVALFGPPLAGKTAIISALAEQFSQPLERLIGSHGLTEVTAVCTDDFAVAAVTGSKYCPEELPDLLRWANHVLFVIDPQRPRESAARTMLAQFNTLLANVPTQAVQVTKTDLAEAAPPSCIPPDQIANVFGLQHLPIFFSSTNRRQSLTAALNTWLASPAV